MTPEPDYGGESYRGFGRLKDRIALITGGDSGIGRAVALTFAREGAAVAFSHLPDELSDAAKTRELVLSAGMDCLGVAIDLSDPENCAVLIQRVVERFGRIDVLVNNAAHQGTAAESLGDFDTKRLEQTFRVNLLAPFVLAREATSGSTRPWVGRPNRLSWLLLSCSSRVTRRATSTARCWESPGGVCSRD